MAKGQQRSNKEAKKPKKAPTPAIPAGSFINVPKSNTPPKPKP